MFLIHLSQKKMRCFNSEVIEYQCHLRNVMSSEIIGMIISMINCGGDVGHPNPTLRWYYRSYNIKSFRGFLR